MARKNNFDSNRASAAILYFSKIVFLVNGNRSISIDILMIQMISDFDNMARSLAGLFETEISA